tara:strand:- start:2137 stop:3321 length:1185 start_codon:yes stop_codon:yes gene_type:complete
LIINSISKLETFCEKEKYIGWDPYDGLNSKIFQRTLFKNSDICRLILIQFFKRSPFNFRKILIVPKDYNPKALALFINGYSNLYNLSLINSKFLFKKNDIKKKIIFLADKLISLESKEFSGSCWGYNFDWQARRLFYFPKFTPTVVVTSFCVEALLKAYEITKNDIYLKKALSSADFVINDLKRFTVNNGFLFSYSPLKGNNRVFNASLLGVKLLAQVYQYNKKKKYQDIAEKVVSAVCSFQNKDGSWIYGLNKVQTWIDSFHTGYNLESLKIYQNLMGDKKYNENIDRGFNFYINTFFTKTGIPKYYHNNMYPIDIHSPAQLFITLSKLNKFKENKNLAKKTLEWTINNMQDKKGYFYYQVKKGFNSKISYMRWSNAFMFNAMSYYMLELSGE